MDLKDFFDQKMNQSMDIFQQMGLELNAQQMAEFQNLVQMMGESIEPVDIAAQLADYQPQAEDDADEAFVQQLIVWLKAVIASIPDTDVNKMRICYHTAFDEQMQASGDLWFAYQTRACEDEETGSDSPWNFVNWKEHYSSSFPQEAMAAWLAAKGIDLNEDDDGVEDLIYDLAVLAVMQIHAEGMTEARFGVKIPIIIEDYEMYDRTAIRAAKANGTELLDEEFYLECGCTNPNV